MCSCVHVCLRTQEEYALKESFKKAVAQDLRRSYRESAVRALKGTNKVAEQMQALPQLLPEPMQTGLDEVRPWCAWASLLQVLGIGVWEFVLDMLAGMEMMSREG